MQDYAKMVHFSGFSSILIYLFFRFFHFTVYKKSLNITQYNSTMNQLLNLRTTHTLSPQLNQSLKKQKKRKIVKRNIMKKQKSVINLKWTHANTSSVHGVSGAYSAKTALKVHIAHCSTPKFAGAL